MAVVYKKLSLLALLLLFSSSAWAQFTIKGKVTDSNTGESLVGVTIMDKASGNGVVTDADGMYSIDLPGQKATLHFSYIGYIAKEVSVNSSSGAVNVALKQDITNLEEIVVSGLASNVKRSNLANAVSTVDNEELSGTTASGTLDNALYGKIPGVTMTANGGAPGGGINVQLRGISTLGAGSSQPLYIIDGVYVDNSTISTGRSSVSGAGGASQDNVSSRIADLNPEDIENIEVLKGSSAAAIYGARANAGVVIITTKRGQAGRTKVSFSQDVGFASALNLLGYDSWNEDKIRMLYSGARLNTELQRFNEGKRYDWEKVFYGDKGLLTNTQVSVSGGNDRTQFYVGAGLQKEDGIIKNTGFDRNSIRANIDHELTSRIKVSSSSNYINTKSDRGFTGNQNGTGGSIGYNIAYIPSYFDLYPDAQGNYPDNPYFAENPLALRDHAVNNQEVNRFIQSLKLDANLYQNDVTFLKLQLQGGLDYLNSNSEVYFPEWFQSQQASANPGDVIHGKQDDLNTNMQGFFIFNTAMKNTSFNTQVGMTYLTQDENRLLVRGRGLAPGQVNMNQAQVQEIFGQQFQTVRELGLVGQQEVNWDEKLIATVGVRFDKSTLNAKQNHFYAFPKASLAANLANFDFWKLDAVNQFKLRVAYGETGGVPQFGRTFEALGGTNIGGQLGSTVSTRATDPNLKPETASELEFGGDFGFLDNRIGLTATYYIKKVKDLILDLTPAASTGIDAIATNAADLENKGIELGLTVSPVQNKSVNWVSKLMYWKNDTKITRLDIPSYTTGGFGVALGSYLIREGVSPTMIVGNPQDPGLTFYGDAQPDYQMSWYNQVNFLKHFELSFLFQMQQGGKNINLSSFLLDGGGNTPDWSEDSDGDGTPNGMDRGPFDPHRFVEDASYLKLRELGLYYTLPDDITTALHARRVKVGVSGKNLLLFSGYSSYDPEVSNFGAQPIARSVEVTPYPSSRKVYFHVQFDF